MEEEEYREAFIRYIVDYCKNYNYGMYDQEDEKRFNKLANDEYEAQIDGICKDDLDFDNPELDAKECISYWD